MAFNGSSYKVNNERMRIRFSSNTTTYILDLKNTIDYSCVNMINPPPPTITVTVSPNNDHPSYNQETADKFGKEYLNRLANNDNSYRLEKTSIDNFGNNKAFYAELISSSNVIRAYLLTNDNNKFEIIVNSNKGDNFIYTETYRKFANSFEIPKTQPQTVKKGSSRSTLDNLMRVPDTPPNISNHKGGHRHKRGPTSPLELIIIFACLFLAFIAWKIKSSL